MFPFAFSLNVYVPPSASRTGLPLASLIPPSVFASVPVGNANVAVKANSSSEVVAVPFALTTALDTFKEPFSLYVGSGSVGFVPVPASCT